VFFDVAYQSYLPHLVGREHLVEGNAKLGAVGAVSQISGPAIAGLAIQALTAPLAVALDAASFAGSALFVARIGRREELPERKPDAHLVREVMEGVRFVFGNPLLRPIAMSAASANFFIGISSAMAIVLLARVLHLPAGMIGVFFSIASVGGLVGALIATRVARRLGQGRTIWISQAVTGLFRLAVPLAQRGWLLWTVAFSLALAFAASVVYNVTQLSFRQGLTPEHLLGRMNATMRFLVWGTLPLGGLIGGVLGQLLGPRPTLWVAAIGGLPIIWCHGQPATPILNLIAQAAHHVDTVTVCPDADLGGVHIAARIHDHLRPHLDCGILDTGTVEHHPGRPFNTHSRTHLATLAERRDDIGRFAQACLTRGYAIEQEAAARGTLRAALET
jgi:hypothetical protein